MLLVLVFSIFFEMRIAISHGVLLPPMHVGSCCVSNPDSISILLLLIRCFSCFQDPIGPGQGHFLKVTGQTTNPDRGSAMGSILLLQRK